MQQPVGSEAENLFPSSAKLFKFLFDINSTPHIDSNHALDAIVPQIGSPECNTATQGVTN
ncbi:MAG: hypothetical protein VKJ24_21900 [Synechococcales bacterium]|nr:hypothetical protein [Synechococcales bacterium]